MPAEGGRTVEGKAKRLRQEQLDSFIVTYFPAILVLFAALVAVLGFVFDAATAYDIIYWICEGFAIGFAFLGLICVVYMGTPIIKHRYTIPLFLSFPVILAIALYMLHDYNVAPALFVSRFFYLFGDGSVTLHTLLLGFLTIEIAIFLVAAAVSSVISAYFKRYFSRIMLGMMNKDPENRARKASYWLFNIPEVLDVEDVVLDPTEEKGFNHRVFGELVLYLFVTGLITCSYIFLNPYFVIEMPLGEMIMMALLLSLFIATLIIPWNIIRAVGAKAKTQAPRDIYLWKGMKGRLSLSLMAIFVFFMMIIILAYFKVDLSKVLISYGSYMVMMLATAIIYSFVYVNVYYVPFKNGLIESFNAEKEKRRRKAEKP